MPPRVQEQVAEPKFTALASPPPGIECWKIGLRCFAYLSAVALLGVLVPRVGHAQNRYASSDNLSGFVHWIELLDANNNRIDPTSESPAPYSPAQTCGRCHDFSTISHGWHFNAVDSADSGRPGQPWIWSDARTGTHLPLSYRDWPGTVDPDLLGLSRWQVAAHFGGFLPGGGPGDSAALKGPPVVEEAASERVAAEDAGAQAESGYVDRSQVTGPLPVDCLLCHHRPGSGYSPFVWTEQIEDQNFAYAPTAASGLAVVSGSMKRLKDDFDPAAEDAASKLPRVQYDAARFRADGKVFFDVLRKPTNDACYYCHSNVAAGSVVGERWLHDEDIHVRAGLQCADCHRNGLDHHTVRGYVGEQHPAGTSIASLSCQGCHLGSSPTESLADTGRLGAPRPAHRGLPSVHFEKLSCTACHAGPSLSESAERQLNSIAHRLGAHEKRTGDELPGIVAPVLLPVKQPAFDGSGEVTAAVSENLAVSTRSFLQQPEHDGTGQYTPHRMLWPSYWGTRVDGQVRPLNPELVYELIRRELKVRRGDFVADLSDVKLSLSERKELLGEERARLKPEDWTAEEQAKIAQAEAVARQQQVTQRMAAALGAIETKYPGEQAVFISGGAGYAINAGAAADAAGGDQSRLKQLTAAELGGAADPYAWPLGHNVRSAQQSIGAKGCTDCHSEQAPMFQASVQPVAVLPDQATEPIAMYQLQGADMERLSQWGELFAGRATFKILGLIALGLTTLIAASTMASNLSRFLASSDKN